MMIPGTVADWEEWTGMQFPETGTYVVPGALQPVEIDVESDAGTLRRAERLDAPLDRLSAVRSALDGPTESEALFGRESARIASEARSGAVLRGGQNCVPLDPDLSRREMSPFRAPRPGAC